MLIAASVSAVTAILVTIWAARRRRSGPVPAKAYPIPASSMQATLERRVREGADFTL